MIPIFFLCSSKAQVTFVEKPQLKRISFENYTHWNLIHTWSDTAFKGTFVNPTESSLHWRSLKITLTVSLRKQTLNEKRKFYWNRNFRILLSTDYFNFREENGRKEERGWKLEFSAQRNSQGNISVLHCCVWHIENWGILCLTYRKWPNVVSYL